MMAVAETEASSAVEKLVSTTRWRQTTVATLVVTVAALPQCQCKGRGDHSSGQLTPKFPLLLPPFPPPLHGHMVRR